MNNKLKFVFENAKMNTKLTRTESKSLQKLGNLKSTHWRSFYALVCHEFDGILFEWCKVCAEFARSTCT